MRQIVRLVVMLAMAAAPGLIHAQPQQADESRWRLGAAFGYGERTNPLVQSDDIPIVVDFDIAWFGDRWFFDNGDGGVTFADNDALTASVVGRFNSDRVFFGRTDTRFVTVDALGAQLDVPADFKPPDRDYAIELGVEVLTDGQWGELQLSAFHDASGTHDGFEVFADYRFGWRRQRFYVEPSIGASYKSSDLNDYYWGLTEAEGRGVVPPYVARAGTNWHTRLVIGYQVNLRWAFSFVAEYERLNGEASASPIVEDDHVTGLFAGMSWRF
jgi:outer membrane protein